jgi:hypothetical protein
MVVAKIWSHTLLGWAAAPHRKKRSSQNTIPKILRTRADFVNRHSRATRSYACSHTWKHAWAGSTAPNEGAVRLDGNVHLCGRGCGNLGREGDVFRTGRSRGGHGDFGAIAATPLRPAKPTSSAGSGTYALFRTPQCRDRTDRWCSQRVRSWAPP